MIMTPAFAAWVVLGIAVPATATTICVCVCIATVFRRWFRFEGRSTPDEVRVIAETDEKKPREDPGE